MHWVNKSGFQEKNINISTIRVISYQLEKQCFILQYIPYIIFFRGDLILSIICTSAMHILRWRRRQRAVKWCVVHLPMQNKFVVVVIVYPKRLVSLPPCFSCILCNDVSTPDKHWLIFIVYVTKHCYRQSSNCFWNFDMHKCWVGECLAPKSLYISRTVGYL